MRRCLRELLTFIINDPTTIDQPTDLHNVTFLCHCEEPFDRLRINSVTKQSRLAKSGDCFAPLAMTEGFVNSGECLQSNVTLSNYLLWMAHNLERVADRVINICEGVVFTVTGKA